MSRMLAEFESDQDLVDAAAHMHALGYGAMEAYSPFPIPALDPFLPAHGLRIPAVVLVAAVVGAAGALLIQWGTIRDYPLRVGGFALDSIPAFIPIIFESTVLAGAITAFSAVLIRSGLCQWWHPLDEIEGIERAAIDRFFLAILLNPSNRQADAQCRLDLSCCHPLRIVTMDEAP